MTNREMIIRLLQNTEYESDITTVDFINCPSYDKCKYDGIHSDICDNCKIKWLNSEAQYD